MKHRKLLVASVIITALIHLISPAFLFAEAVYYIYDNTGRLVKAVAETGKVAIYNYDEVGNLISINNHATNPAPPEVHSISPDTVFVALMPRNLLINISGENLLGTEAVWSDSSGITVNSYTATDSSITANITVLPDLPLSETFMNVRTVYGSGNIPLNLARLYFDPAQIAAAVGTSVDVAARIEGGLPKNYTIMLNNSIPEIVTAPESIVVPSGSRTMFTVAGIQEGTGAIKAENTGMSIYITKSFSGDAIATTKPVSIDFDQQLPGMMTSTPVSIEFNSNKPGTVMSSPVSVELSKIQSLILSNTVSVKIEN